MMEEGAWHRLLHREGDPLTFDDFLRLFLNLCPKGEMGEDNNGQLVFYTSMHESTPGTVEDMPDEEV